jgi:hypothetical protein
MRDVHVFRDTRHEISGPRLLAELWASLGKLASCGNSAPPRSLVEDALLRAGELESLLTDRGLDGAVAMAALADALADALIAPDRPLAIDLCASPASPSLTLPAWLLASPPEGFAHHAVHPLDFAELARRLPLSAAPAVVIGLRPIGTTLSAVVAATLRARGIPAPRFTVRPEGHSLDLDRVVRLGAPAQRWIREEAASGASFFVVDEGSGSSLLAAAEALIAAGAPRGRITLLCTHAPDPETLLAPDAARRLRAFALHATGPSRVVPEEAALSLPAGAWRKHVFTEEHQVPPIWPALERRKLLSQDRQRLFKFEGLGRWGASALGRANVLHEAGFGLPTEDAGHGYLVTPWIDSAPLRPESLTTALLHRLSAYCAFRASAFPSSAHHAGDLELMIRKNALAALGRELGPRVELPLGRPVIADARMMPHEWIAVPGALPLKLDGIAHGDDHLFPGPVDVAWDLAGAIVEWRMSASARRVFLDSYHRASGDGCESRLPAYLYAYTLSRLAWSIAAAASAPSEAPRLRAAEQRYRAVLQSLPSPW